VKKHRAQEGISSFDNHSRIGRLSLMVVIVIVSGD
jgi:hypothetical protein